MAGVKGKSGGYREGAGRKPAPKPAPVLIPETDDMLKLLQDIARGVIDATPMQVKAAIAAVAYTHAKKGETGKKEDRQDAAQKVAAKFGARPVPLKLVNDK